MNQEWKLSRRIATRQNTISDLKPFGCDDISAHPIPLMRWESLGSWLVFDLVDGISLIQSLVIIPKSLSNRLTVQSLRV